jgi:hypothetical protein
VSNISPRLFSSDADIRRIGEQLLALQLPRSDWTHEAHLAVCCWLLQERIDIDAERELPTFIRLYNQSVGVINDDTQGYHETITQSYIKIVRQYLSACASEMSLCLKVNNLLQSSFGRRDCLLQYYSKELLFSIEARRVFVAPDLSDFD